MFAGRRLADDDLLKTHLIGRHATVQMTLNLNGGMVTDDDTDSPVRVRSLTLSLVLSLSPVPVCLGFYVIVRLSVCVSLSLVVFC